MEEPVKVVLLMSSLSSLKEYHTITTPINALSEHTITWDYATSPLIKKGRRKAQRRLNEQDCVSKSMVVVTASKFKREQTQLNTPSLPVECIGDTASPITIVADYVT